MWELLPPEIGKALGDEVDRLTDEAAWVEGSVARRCPRCGGSFTTDCNEITAIADPSVGLCVACGYLWCLECDTHLIATVTCGHWKICANCGERKDESGFCHTLVWECRHIKKWIERANPRA